ncbi:hypothetical protein EKD04_019525 [Chloroflexales bacterium ZM16-3]|nr:hypothetical protein [Chloroflexales bacterium ZM16-3]
MRDLAASGIRREAIHLTRIDEGVRRTTASPARTDMIIGVIFGGLLGGTIGAFAGALFMSIPVLSTLILSVMAGVGIGGNFASMIAGIVAGLIIGGIFGGVTWDHITAGDVVVTAEVEDDDRDLITTIFRYDGALSA